jgi:hypothetical protein
LAGLPVEEIAFFIVIPLVTVLTYEAVQAVGKEDGANQRRPGREVL